MIRQAEAARARRARGTCLSADGRTGPCKAHKSLLILCCCHRRAPGTILSHNGQIIVKNQAVKLNFLSLTLSFSPFSLSLMFMWAWGVLSGFFRSFFCFFSVFSFCLYCFFFRVYRLLVARELQQPFNLKIMINQWNEATNKWIRTLYRKACPLDAWHIFSFFLFFVKQSATYFLYCFPISNGKINLHKWQPSPTK